MINYGLILIKKRLTFSIYFNYSNLKDEIMMDDLQHEEILNNFDQFIKMAGSELLTLKDVARNITGWTDIDQRPSFHISYFIFLYTKHEIMQITNHNLLCSLDQSWLF